jgi:hypothetical protein
MEATELLAGATKDESNAAKTTVSIINIAATIAIWLHGRNRVDRFMIVQKWSVFDDVRADSAHDFSNR